MWFEMSACLWGSRRAWIAIVFAAVSAMSCGAQSTFVEQINEQVSSATGHPRNERCGDSVFLRRVSLDLIGRVPTVEEQREFETNPDRTIWVDRLLSSEEFPRFWSQLWTTLYVGRFAPRQVDRELLRMWIEEQIKVEKPLDSIAFELLSATGTSTLDGQVNYVLGNREDQVLRLGRAFLGVQLDCAKCHDHPFDRWTNEDYTLLERFFQPLRFREVAGGVVAEDLGNVSHAENSKPRFLTKREPSTSAWRRELALMVVRCKPFSRSMVNRVWYWTMGRGICEPIDAISKSKQAREFEVLDAIASRFAAEGFRLRTLLKAICLSEPYCQVVAFDAAMDDAYTIKNLNQRTVRRLLPEQWILSVRTVSGSGAMTGKQLSEATQQLLGRRERTLSGDPFDWVSNSQMMLRELASPVSYRSGGLGHLMRATLSRGPTEAEHQLMADYTGEQILFALIHGNEFLTNQ